MKKVMFTGMALVLGAVNVFANCTSDTAVSASVLAGKSVDASGSGGEWNESHCGSAPSGQLWKVGANNSVDPAAEIGTWSIDGDNVTYDYGTGGSYTWTLHKSVTGSTYFFCNNTSQVASGTLGDIGACSPPSLQN